MIAIGLEQPVGQRIRAESVAAKPDEFPQKIGRETGGDATVRAARRRNFHAQRVDLLLGHCIPCFAPAFSDGWLNASEAGMLEL
jgi:hypothetical protein